MQTRIDKTTLLQTTTTLLVLGIVAFIAMQPAQAIAQAESRLPKIAQGIGVDQNLGDDLPMYVEFDDEQNRHIQFGELFRYGKPVLLSFNYSRCEKLCNVQLQNLASALQNIDLVPGKDFHIVSISIDPTEQSTTLAESKRKYVVAYGDTKTADGWHFLRGDKENISKLADACGFKYKYDPDLKIYSHPAAFIFCTSDGKIARYLDGLSGQLEESLNPALIEAGQGKIGSVKDRVAYFAGCYIFDATTGKYSVSAIRIMRLGGYITVIALLCSLAPFWLGRRKKAKSNDENNDPKLDSESGIPANNFSKSIGTQ